MSEQSVEKREPWSREQALAVLRLYFATPFGKLHASNPDIVALAKLIGRSANSVAMKASNFASLDPAITETGRKGLSGASKLDRAIWEELREDSGAVSEEAESVYESYQTKQHSFVEPGGPTEGQRLVKVRKVQAFFRRAVLASYDSTCVITGLKVRGLLRASHILPWSTHPTRRADPTNGLCLSALFDAAFDRGLVTIDDDLRVVVSGRLRRAAGKSRLGCSVGEAHGERLILPAHRRPPDGEALGFHRERVFREE